MTDSRIKTDEERLPSVAGMFYPKDPLELSGMISGYLKQSDRIVFSDNIHGIIAPHAGYMYSGLVAAKAYKQLEGLKYDNVVVISPSHTTFFQGVSIYNGSAYVTPLGKLFINTDLAIKLADINPKKVFLSSRGHSGGGMRQEHALEVQLPLLQMVLGDFKLIPIVMGEQEWDIISALAECLHSALNGTNTLIVASTDLSHFYSSEIAHKKDTVIKDRVEQFDVDGLYKAISKGEAEACGGGPMISAMITARKMGADRIDITGFSDSGEVTGDGSEVVGYLSGVIYED